jgi:group I intron endonuclease
MHEENMEKGFIYKIENKVNHKVYIGQTRHSPNGRWKEHIYELENHKKKNKKFQVAWDKYGLTSFEFSVIEECVVSELDDREIYYISKYDSFKNGYNATTGGNQVMHNQKHTPESLRRMSVKSKENWADASFRKKMMQRPVYFGEEAPRATRVICVNDNKIFKTLLEAGEHYGIGLKKVSSVCTGKCAYTGLEETGRKLEFAYYEPGETYKLKNVKHCNEKSKVKCLNTGIVYDSIKEAGDSTGAPSASISHVCHGERKHAGRDLHGNKLTWSFV